jgi:hypothetical protein
MAALILPLISNKNGAVYDSTVGVISRLLQSDVAKAGDPQRASEILVRVVKREHLSRVHHSQPEPIPDTHSQPPDALQHAECLPQDPG